MTEETSDVEQLKIEREELKKTVDSLTDGKYWVLEICLSVKAQMLIEGISLPFFLVLIGAASSFKTAILRIMEALPDCYKTGEFTSKAFVSHMANVKEENLSKIDLLPRIKDKTLITPELSPLFSAKEENLIGNIGLLTSILDGRGHSSDSGARGHRGYEGEYYFTWIGAIVSLSRHVMRIIGNMGPKMYFLHIEGQAETDEETEQRILQTLEDDSYLQKLEESRKQVCKLWDLVKRFPEQRSGKIVWNKEKDNPETKKKLASTSMLLGRLRTSVSYEEIGEQKLLRVSSSENPSRAATLMQYLARGHAVLYGRNYILDEDLGVVIRVALSSAYRERVQLLRALLENKGELNTEQVMQELNVSRQTALNVMKEAEIVGLVEKAQQDAETKPYAAIKLKNSFRWLLSEEYSKYWRRT